MSASSCKRDESDDEFESADEGEPVPVLVKKSHDPLTKNSWNDWNTNDEPIVEASEPVIIQQDSVSSLSSSPSKAGSLSRADSDEEDRIDPLTQQRSQRKRLQRREGDSSSSSSTSLIRHDIKETHHLLDQLAAQSPTVQPSWSTSWSNIGSFFSTAKQSVSTLTSTVSEGFSAVIESVEAGLGAPDPLQLAEMNRMAFKIKGETSESEDEPDALTSQPQNVDSVTNQDGWLNALSLDKLTNTGMKVVSGSLDVLETVGKKTFDVINEADPDLRGARRLLTKQNRPTLSEVIREAQHELDTKPFIVKNENVTFLPLFEKHQGLAHFEVLESLSAQSSIMLQTTPYDPLLEQISTYFRIADDDDDDDDDELTLNSLTIQANHEEAAPTLEVLSQNFTAYQTQLRSTIPVDKLLEVYESANQCLQDWEWMDTEADQKTLADEAIDSLAILCASIVEYYRKTAELFLIGCKSLTSFSIDIELLSIYQKQQQDFSRMLAGIPTLFARHMRQISSLPSTSSSTDGPDLSARCDSNFKQTLLNHMFIQSSSSQTYASDAYVLLKPIVSQSILYHRSTIR